LIVVDLGCFPHRHEISIEPLITQYAPDVLYGFDPWPGLVEGEIELERTRVVLRRKAAWIENGVIEFARVGGLRGWDSTIVREKASRDEWLRSDIILVPCFDFSSWLRELPEAPIVKMDVEGSEFQILERMVDEGTDRLVGELLVEWHENKMIGEFAEPKERLLAALRCPVASWEPVRTGRLRAGLRSLRLGLRRPLGTR
jgi:FkbM family methyltransferase